MREEFTMSIFANKDDLIEALYKRVEYLEKDSERLDWLSMQYVVVRKPLRFGSLACFQGTPEDPDGWEEEPWDLRGNIDNARLASK